MKRVMILSVFLTLSLLVAAAAAVPEMVSFEPVRAPSKGPDDAPVTVIEIADFM